MQMSLLYKISMHAGLSANGNLRSEAAQVFGIQ